MADMVISITLDAKELRRQLGLTQEEIAKIDGKEIKVKTDAAASGVDGLRKALAETTIAFAGVVKGLQLLVKGIKAIIGPSAEMEQLRLRLEAMYRDADKAKDAFDEFRKVAAKTPASLMQVAEAGAQLKAFGMEAEDTVEVAANLAAYMGTNIVDAANAMGRAFAGGAGSAEQLRRRGILELISSFTGIEDLTKLTLPEFRRVLVETLEDPAAGIAGTAETMAESYTGAVSNMQDAMYQLRAKIGNEFLPTLTEAALGVGRLINNMLGLATEQQRVTQATFEQRVEFEVLIGRFTKLHQETQKTDEQNREYQKTIDDLLDKYPNYLDKQTLEKGNWEDIAEHIGDARTELEKYLRAQVEDAIMKDALTKLKEAEIAVKRTETAIGMIEGRQKARGDKPTDMNPEGLKIMTTVGYLTESYENTISRMKSSLDKEMRDAEKAFEEYEMRRTAFLSTFPEDEVIAPKDKDKDKRGSGTGTGTASSVEAEVSETAQAYEKLLENLRKYHSDAALANLDAHQKKLALLSREFDEEQELILASMAAKEITEEEGQSRLAEVRAKYDAEALIVQKAAEDELLKLAQKRIDQAVKDEEQYYEMMKFADENYFEWKKKKIEEEVSAMAIGDQQKLDLIKELLEELDEIKAEHDYTEPDKKGSWFFSGLLGYDPGNPEDEAKVQAIKDTFSHLFNQTTSVASGLLRLSIQRRDTEIAALEERAQKEGWTNERLLKEKTLVINAYAAEERRYKNIQKNLSLAQAAINIAEGVTKALSMGPIIGPIMAKIITALGAVQIGIISAQKFASGGLFRGKGGPRDDANLAYLSDGEYIVNAAATKRFKPVLDAINYGQNIAPVSKAAYADGGMVVGGGHGLSEIRQDVKTVIDRLEVINLNLVKKKVEVNIQGSASAADIRDTDASRLRMEERGYDPSFAQ